MTPPASTEPHPLRCETCEKYGEGKYADTCENIPFPDHMDSADRQYIKDWIREHGCASHSARGPVTAQAPAITLPKDMTNLECIDEGLKGLSDYFNAALEGGESKAALRRMWDQQMGILAALLKNHQNEPILSGVKNALAEYQAYEKGFSDGKKEHDAALIAQEREKWERDLRVDAQNPWCYPGCILVDKAKAQAREHVLDELAQMYANVPEQFLEGTYRLHSEWKEKIESLRHGQKQESEE